MLNDFVLAVASGKGGTGKTTVAVNLAQYAVRLRQKVQYLDCDVEEPNGHIFLKPKITKTSDVTLEVPNVNQEKCVGCGKCGKICQYSAILSIAEHKVLTFENLCHSCGGCVRVCPTGAIEPKKLRVGEIEVGKAGNVDFVQGKLDIGYVRTPSVIKDVKKNINKGYLAIVDVPPGTSCPVVAAIKDVDFVLLVTEPTPFGLNDLRLAVDLVRKLKLPFAVAINRSDLADGMIEQYCVEEKIEIILRIPDDRRIAEAYSVGNMFVNVLPEYEKIFSRLYEYILQIAGE